MSNPDYEKLTEEDLNHPLMLAFRKLLTKHRDAAWDAGRRADNPDSAGLSAIEEGKDLMVMYHKSMDLQLRIATFLVDLEDEFNGDTPHLINCIHALLSLDETNALRPHGLGGHAKALLTSAAERLKKIYEYVPFELRKFYEPYLINRADAVDGHYAIGRRVPSDQGFTGHGYQEVWNLRSHGWSSASDEVLSLEEATKLLKELTIHTS